MVVCGRPAVPGTLSKKGQVAALAYRVVVAKSAQKRFLVLREEFPGLGLCCKRWTGFHGWNLAWHCARPHFVAVVWEWCVVGFGQCGSYRRKFA